MVGWITVSLIKGNSQDGVLPHDFQAKIPPLPLPPPFLFSEAGPLAST